MGNNLRNWSLVLCLAMLLLTAGSGWADTVALSFSGGTPYTWPGATIGWKFTTTQTITVTSLGVWESGTVLTDSHDVGIFATGGALLVSTTVTASDPLTNGFRYHGISPYILPPGTYVIGSYMPTSADEGVAGAISSTQAPVTYNQNLYLYGSGFTLPTTVWVGYDSGNFGANFQFVISSFSVPTLNEWGIIIFLLFAGFGSIYYLRRQKRANS